MKTVVLGNLPAELESFIAKRKALGQDLHDEMWEGEHHVAPAAHGWHGVVAAELLAVLRPAAKRAGLIGSDAFNVGSHHLDFRVPDGGFHRVTPDAVWVETAAIVVEVVSPDDETFEKFGFYARHRVDEIIVADPAERTVRMFARREGGYDEVDRSALLGVTSAEVTAAIDWPR